jgi:hypothetical protein
MQATGKTKKKNMILFVLNYELKIKKKNEKVQLTI